MKILYLASGHAKLSTNHEVIYNDLYIKRDIQKDMMEVDINGYDLIIATPPCNYWSRANYRRETSEYAQKTKNLLPAIIEKLQNCQVPVIIENVINKSLMVDLINNKLFYYEIGRHCYFTNRLISFLGVSQKRPKIQNMSSKKRQGTDTKIVFEEFIKQELDIEEL